MYTRFYAALWAVDLDWIAGPGSEIDISVSKLLDFETFAKSLRVSVSVSEKKSRFRF